jgi:uncharacterized damage-inducible protein DinB
LTETVVEYTQRLLSYSEGSDPLSIQASTADKLAGLIGDRSREQLFRAPAAGKWSIAQIMAHLADAELAIAWRLRQILSSNGVPLQAYDQDSWASTFNYAERDPRESLATFRALRAADLALLKSVPKALWDNYGMHQERGKETIHHMATMTAGHDLNHLRQIEKIVSDQNGC